MTSWRHLCGTGVLACSLISTVTLGADVATPKPLARTVFSDVTLAAPATPWRINHGDWKVVDGAWQVAELSENKHPAVVRYPLEFTNGVIEFDFKLDGAKMVSISINDAKGHLCRLQVYPTRWRLMKDDNDKDRGPDKPEELAAQTIEIKPGQWYHVRLEFKGPDMLAQVGDSSATGKHEAVAKPKTNVGLVVSGQTASIKNLRMSIP